MTFDEAGFVSQVSVLDGWVLAAVGYKDADWWDRQAEFRTESAARAWIKDALRALAAEELADKRRQAREVDARIAALEQVLR